MSSVVGLEMPNAWRTGQFNDANFDISANQLNITSNREMWIPTGSIDWATALHTNAADPVSPQDLATKFYVDSFGGNLWSTFPAIQDVDYDSLYKNINMVDPINPQDSATKNYVDNFGGATDLDELTDVTIIAPANQEFLRFNSTSSQWENVAFTPATSNAIEQMDSSVTVIDTGANGRVETVIDNSLKLLIDANIYDIKLPITMNSQQINSLGTPAVATDAATKGYVDTEIAALPIKTDLDSLTDVTITAVALDNFLVNNGAGQWVNLAMTKGLLPAEIAYEDETNTFTLTQNMNGGILMGLNATIDYNSGQSINQDSMRFIELSIDPPDPALTSSVMFLDDGADFNSPNPVWEVLIDRDGVIEKKPVVTSETVFALNQFSNGMFTQETGTKVITDGGIGLRVQIFNENQVGQSFEVVLDGQIFVIPDPDTSLTIGNTIDLSAGTDTAPTKHWVWIFNNAGVITMTSNTTGFPSSGDFAVVGTFLFQSQASVLADGSYAVNSPDYEIFDQDARGHLAHLNDRLSTQDALYVSGIAISVLPDVGGGTLGNVTYTTTAGSSFELHLEDIESFDITTGIALVENEGTQTALEVTRVNDLGLDMVGLTCANGTTVISNNDRINVVIYTIHNDDEPNQTNYGINVPFNTYATDSDAIADVNGFAIKTLPLNIRGISMLISEVVIAITGGATAFEVLAIKDLRGQLAGSQGGTGGGGSGVSQLNDLSDVTITTALIDQLLVNDGAGQWRNVPNPAGLLAADNIWTGFQDYTEQTIPADPAATDMRFYVKRIDASNQGLFVKLEQGGLIKELRLA